MARWCRSYARPSNINKDIIDMLDFLSMPLATQAFNKLIKSPTLSDYNVIQFLREVIEPQYIENQNKQFETNLHFSKLINKDANAELLKSGNGRVYNDLTVEQILSFNFVQDRLNVGIYGVTGVGKSYFLSACCIEACRLNFRCKYIDYSELLDELIFLKRQSDLSKYRKRIKYYSRIQILFIDDFAISKYSEEGINILYQLIKDRDELGTSTVFTSQYSPDEWVYQLSDEPGCYGKLDGIRRRLTTGFTLLIEKN